MVPQEVFLSHCAADRLFVDRLVESMRRHGVPVWYSATNILGAQQWHDEIGAALRRCDWFTIVLSSASVNSFWVKRELCYALQQRKFVSRITPILFEPCDSEPLSWTLAAYQFVSFQSGFETGCRELLKIWGVGFHV